MSHNVFFEIGVAEALYRRPDLAEETIRAPGSTIGTYIHIAAAMAEEVEFDGIVADEDGYLDTARGDALTRYVASEYGEARNGATAASVELTLSRVGTDEVELESGFVFEADGVQFAFDTAVLWPASDTSDKTVTATATTVGPDTNLPSGRSWAAISTLPDASITAANAEPAAGGNVEEQDDDLVARIRDLQARKVRGTTGAIRLGALEVAAVREASVYETLGLDGTPSGGVILAIADETGNANAALVEDVELEEEEWRPAGCYLQALAGTPSEQSISVTTVWEPGYGSLADRNALKSAIAARVNKLAPRAAPDDETAEAECVLSHAVITEVRPIIPGLKKITPTVPAGAVEPAQGGVIRTRPGLVTVS